MLDLVSVFMAWRWGCINTYDARKRSVRLRDEGAPQEFLWTMNWFINLELDRSWLMFIIAKYTGLRRSPKWKEKSHGLQINWRSNMEPQEIGVRDEISQIWTLGRGSLQEKPNIYSVIRSWLAKQVALLSEFFFVFFLLTNHMNFLLGFGIPGIWIVKPPGSSAWISLHHWGKSIAVPTIDQEAVRTVPWREVPWDGRFRDLWRWPFMDHFEVTIDMENPWLVVFVPLKPVLQEIFDCIQISTRWGPCSIAKLTPITWLIGYQLEANRGVFTFYFLWLFKGCAHFTS